MIVASGKENIYQRQTRESKDKIQILTILVIRARASQAGDGALIHHLHLHRTIRQVRVASGKEKTWQRWRGGERKSIRQFQLPPIHRRRVIRRQVGREKLCRSTRYTSNSPEEAIQQILQRTHLTPLNHLTPTNHLTPRIQVVARGREKMCLGTSYTSGSTLEAIQRTQRTPRTQARILKPRSRGVGVEMIHGIKMVLPARRRGQMHEPEQILSRGEPKANIQ